MKRADYEIKDGSPATEQEISAARTAFLAVRDLDGYAAAIKAQGEDPRDCVGPAKKLKSIWAKMTEGQRAVFLRYLAPEAYAMDYDIGRAANDLIEDAKRPPGGKGEGLERQRVVLSLWESWVARGNPPLIGNVRTGKKGTTHQPYAALIFIAEAAVKAAPDAGWHKDQTQYEVQVDSILRELRTDGTISVLGSRNRRE